VTAAAVDVQAGTELLREVVSVSAAFAAVQRRGGTALISLMETTTLNCPELGRLRPADCESKPGTTAEGDFETVLFGIMDHGVERALPGLQRALSAEPRLFFATRDPTEGRVDALLPRVRDRNVRLH
jgi:hypothetical protein